MMLVAIFCGMLFIISGSCNAQAQFDAQNDFLDDILSVPRNDYLRRRHEQQQRIQQESLGLMQVPSSTCKNEDIKQLMGEFLNKVNEEQQWFLQEIQNMIDIKLDGMMQQLLQGGTNQPLNKPSVSWANQDQAMMISFPFLAMTSTEMPIDNGQDQAVSWGNQQQPINKNPSNSWGNQQQPIDQNPSNSWGNQQQPINQNPANSWGNQQPTEQNAGNSWGNQQQPTDNNPGNSWGN